MILSFHPCLEADTQIILGSRSLNQADRKLISKAEAIILPQTCSHDLYRACKEVNAHVFPAYEMRFEYPGKRGQSLLFEQFNCPHPLTFGWPDVKAFEKEFSRLEDLPHDLPFLVKDDKSHEGEGVYFIDDRPALSKALRRLTEKEKDGFPGFVTQSYVPCGGNVLRAVIIGKNVITYWKRPPKPAQVITTISRGALIDHDLRPDLQEKGKQEVLGLSQKTGIDLAAVDFVFPLSEEDPNPYFLEINYYFGRRGLGGTENYYNLLFEAVQAWLMETGLNPKSVKLV